VCACLERGTDKRTPRSPESAAIQAAKSLGPDKATPMPAAANTDILCKSLICRGDGRLRELIVHRVRARGSGLARESGMA